MDSILKNMTLLLLVLMMMLSTACNVEDAGEVAAGSDSDSYLEDDYDDEDDDDEEDWDEEEEILETLYEALEILEEGDATYMSMCVNGDYVEIGDDEVLNDELDIEDYLDDNGDVAEFDFEVDQCDDYHSLELEDVFVEVDLSVEVDLNADGEVEFEELASELMHAIEDEIEEIEEEYEDEDEDDE